MQRGGHAGVQRRKSPARDATRPSSSPTPAWRSSAGPRAGGPSSRARAPRPRPLGRPRRRRRSSSRRPTSAASPPMFAAVGEAGGVVVGPDTGPVRLAAAVGARTVALFGPTAAARYGLEEGTNLQGLPGVPAPHADRDHRTGLLVGRRLPARARARLSARSPRRPCAPARSSPAGRNGDMRYLDLPTAKSWSAIGLGTWQFGSREWGYGQRLRRRPGQRGRRGSSRAPSSSASRSSTPPRSTASGAASASSATPSTAPTPTRRPPSSPPRSSRCCPSTRSSSSAARPAPPGCAASSTSTRSTSRTRVVGDGTHHGRHADPAGRGRRRRGRRQQLLARPLAGRRDRAGHPGDLQPGAVQPRLPRARTRSCCPTPAPPGARSSPTARSPRACCPASSTPTTGPRTACARSTRSSCPRACAA